ncbi:MAG TPA: glycosyltransferase family 4 protein [Steroidobacteraceae bacterium]|nr:glycosyltransferase family 4 protein [Steroidobacteraceae bacterium]
MLFLLNSLMVGGSETKSIRIANALAARGSDVTVAYLNPPEQLIGEIEPRVRTLNLRRRGKFSLRAWRGLVDAIRARGTPVVVAMNLYPALYAALARTWLGRDRFRLLMSVNVTDFVSREHERRMLLYRRVLKRADTVIFGAETQRRLWRERYGIGGDGRGRGKEASSVVLYNGVDTDRFTPDARTPGAHRFVRTRYVIGTVGRMRTEKAQHTLVAVTAALRSQGIDVGALLVGDGPERPRILAEIDAHGMQPFVMLAGEAKDVRPYLTDMDVFVLPSISVETFSNAALEALACGVPVVCSRIGGMEELIGYGGGVSYAAGDVRDLTNVLARLLGDDVERQRLARAARRAAVEHFGWDRMIDRFLSLAATR